jgi:hypothetical protein
MNRAGRRLADVAESTRGRRQQVVDLAAIVRQLEDVATRHPEAATELEPVIAALGDATSVTIDAAQAARLLGWPSAATVEAWIALGGLPAERDASGDWRIPLAAVLAMRDRQAALLAFGDESLTEDELAALAAGRPGRWPWQRPPAAG